ncbi:MAG: hypothetical protein PHS41_02680 [Victivallaceae bacterium]|nr:hypothetical protein [Victivallaceae bacterium]
MNSKDKKKMNAEIAEAAMGEMERAEYFVLENWKKFLAVALVVIVAAALFVHFRAAAKRSEIKAADAFGRAATVETLQKAIAEYPSSSGVVAAKIKLARLYASQKDYAKAAAQFQSILAGEVPSDLAGAVRMENCYMIEMEGKLPEAAAAFGKLAGNLTLSPERRTEAAFAAGRLYASLGELEKARGFLAQMRESARSGDISYHWNMQGIYLESELATAKK